MGWVVDIVGGGGWRGLFFMGRWDIIVRLLAVFFFVFVDFVFNVFLKGFFLYSHN